jgi:hypothetical protein
MSRQLALDTVWLRPTPRLAHTEYSLEYHTDTIRERTGLDPSDPRAIDRFYALCGIDFLWRTNDGLHGDWGRRGRITDMGHAEYAADGSDMRRPQTCPFETTADVWAFDPIREYGLPDFDAQVASYEAIVAEARVRHPDQLVPGGYYKTIVSGAIQAFGWEMLLAAAADRARIERVFDRFFRFTLFHMEAWAKTNVEVIIQHDDFVWTAGAFMHPDLYRKVLIPRYAELWKPLRAAGKKVLFCSDGNFSRFTEDVVRAGADGLIFEPCNDFGFMVERFGQSIALVGSCVDCRQMSFGTWDDVQAAMDRTFALVRGGGGPGGRPLSPPARGLIFAVGNHLPANVPGDRLAQYVAYLQANWCR